MDEPTQTNIEKLADFLKSRGITKIHYSCAPHAAKMTVEEWAEYLLGLHTRCEADIQNVVPIPVSQLALIADALRELTKLGQTDVREMTSMSKEVRELKSQIFRLAEFPSMFAEQYLPLDLQKKRREKRKAAREALS